MKYSYIIIDDDPEAVLNTKIVVDGFLELIFVASATNYADGLNLILEHSPNLIFLEIDPADKTSNLSLALINELYRYLKIIPKIIVTTTRNDLAYAAIQYEVTDYLLKPIRHVDLLKLISKLNKSLAEVYFRARPNGCSETISTLLQGTLAGNNPKQKTQSAACPLVICIKSYGDYRYIDAKDICYLHADNNSTDIYLVTGEMITAFKTLKYFEAVLSFPFIRIHNSYMVNSAFISRLHTGSALCYIKNSSIKLPFSKSYKSNVDLIIADFASRNYIEI